MTAQSGHGRPAPASPGAGLPVPTLSPWWEVVREDGAVLTVDGRPGRFSRLEAGFLACLTGARSRMVGAD